MYPVPYEVHYTCKRSFRKELHTIIILGKKSGEWYSNSKTVVKKGGPFLNTHTHADAEEHVITHTHTDAEVHMHTHTDAEGHVHSHTHTHDPAEMKKIINRLSRSIGHLESVKRMIENGQDCSDVLIQLAAVRAEINNAGKALLKEHLEHCIVEAVEEKDQDSIEKVNKAIDQFIR